MTIAVSEGRSEAEQLLFEYLRHLDLHRKDRLALHVAISRLRYSSRKHSHVCAAADGFSDLVTSLQAQMFVLGNNDILLFYPRDAHPRVQSEASKLCYLFADDPLLIGSRDGRGFVFWFDVATDFAEIARLVCRLHPESVAAAEPTARSGQRPSALPATKRRKREQELTPEIVARLEAGLAQTDVSSFVRRHTVCRMAEGLPPKPMFSELTVSIDDLAETVLPGFDLRSNAWLFQYLTETFDRRMLALLAQPDRSPVSSTISINLNISTLLSRDFQVFEERLFAGRRGTIVIELKATDILADIEAYAFARRLVQSRGYRVCIDGLTHRTIDVVDRTSLGADYVKLDFTGDVLEGGPAMRDRLAAVVERNGAEDVILARVETAQALVFGEAAGVRCFQGRHVEQVLSEDRRRQALVYRRQRPLHS